MKIIPENRKRHAHFNIRNVISTTYSLLALCHTSASGLLVPEVVIRQGVSASILARFIRYHNV